MCIIIAGWEIGCSGSELLTTITRGIWVQVPAYSNSAHLLMYFSKTHSTQKFFNIFSTGVGGWEDVNILWSFWLILFLGLTFG